MTRMNADTTRWEIIWDQLPIALMVPLARG